MKRHSLWSIILVGMIWMIIQPASALAAEPVKIRIGQTQGVVSIDTPIFFMKPEILKHYGKTYMPEFIEFRATSAEIPAFAAKELDFGFMSTAAMTSAILNANLDLKIVMDMAADGAPGGWSNQWMVLEESPIKTVKDLKGKTIGSLAYGSGNDVALRVILSKHGLDPKKDVNIVEVALPNMEPMLRQKKIDCALLLPDFYYPAIKKEGLRSLFQNREGMGFWQVLFLVGRTEFLKKYPEVTKDFLQDSLIGLRFIMDPKNRSGLLEWLAKWSKKPVSVFEDWAFIDGKESYRDPDGVPNIESMQQDVDRMVEWKFLPKRIEIKQYVDLGYLNEARKRIR